MKLGIIEFIRCISCFRQKDIISNFQSYIFELLNHCSNAFKSYKKLKITNVILLKWIFLYLCIIHELAVENCSMNLHNSDDVLVFLNPPKVSSKFISDNTCCLAFHKEVTFYHDHSFLFSFQGYDLMYMFCFQHYIIAIIYIDSKDYLYSCLHLWFE